MTIHEEIELTERRLSRYRECEDAILSAQSYSIDGMNMTRAELGLVQAKISELEQELRRLRVKAGIIPGRSRLRMVIPVDGVSMYRARRLL